MIKLLREVSHDHPWILKTIMGLLAIAFIITMGWWGFSEQASNEIAVVGELKIPLDEFRRGYENAYRFYRDNLQGEVKEETIKQMVLDQLIDTRLWLLVARDMNLTVMPEDLREYIVSRPDFQRDGKFDPDLYRRILAANRLTPATFEAMQSIELLANKARTLVRDSVALTPEEISEAQALAARQPQGEPAKGTNKDTVFQDFLFQKQQRAMVAYGQALKSKIPVKIHKELL